MQHKVLKMFCDKKTGKIHLAGSFYGADKKRANELIKLGFLEGEINEEKEPPKEEPPVDPQKDMKKNAK